MASLELTPMEQDILGDMTWDSHGVGELAGFYRAANPAAPDAEVFGFVRGLLAKWIERGWLELGPEQRERAGLKEIGELLPFLDSHGPEVLSLTSDIRLPEVDLAEQAFRDVEWLRSAT